MKLTLQAHNNNWERFNQRRQRPAYKKVRDKILHRDNFTCRFCQLRSDDLEVINYDGYYSNNVDKNLICACILCARCTLLDAYPLDYTGNDRIIYLPELSQEQLNQLCQVIFCKLQSSGEAAYNAKMLLAQLQDRADWLDQRTDCKLSHPAIFVHYLQNQKRDLALVNRLRWLPDPQDYQAQAKHWQTLLFENPEEINF